MRHHHDQRQRLSRKHHLLDQSRVRGNRIRRLQDRRRKERPRQNPGEEKQRIRTDDIGRKEDRERQRVDAEEQERIGERPEEAEDRAAIAGFQIARRQRGDELTMAIQRDEITQDSSVTISISVVDPI
jgi:hypothetical protein